MKLSIISFTANGVWLSVKIAKALPEMDIDIYTKCSFCAEKELSENIQFVECSVSQWTKRQMEQRSALLFVGACGIAVRAVAPYITDKLQDSPVLVMDEKGMYVIPILSGHVGGANELAGLLAEKMSALPVITTATDLNRKFAVDLFAKKNELTITDKAGIAKVSSKVLEGERITIAIETGHIQNNSYIPEGVQLVAYPPENMVDIVVTSEDVVFNASLVLKPKQYVLGMGCRKGKETELIEAFIQRNIEKIGISVTQIKALSSIEQKREEQGFLKWSQKMGIPFITHTADELQYVNGVVHSSAFVKEKVGVDNVCERAALKTCEPDGVLVYEKHAEDGMTIAIAKGEWSVEFDEE